MFTFCSITPRSGCSLILCCIWHRLASVMSTWMMCSGGWNSLFVQPTSNLCHGLHVYVSHINLKFSMHICSYTADVLAKFQIDMRNILLLKYDLKIGKYFDVLELTPLYVTDTCPCWHKSNSPPSLTSVGEQVYQQTVFWFMRWCKLSSYSCTKTYISYTCSKIHKGNGINNSRCWVSFLWLTGKNLGVKCTFLKCFYHAVWIVN